MKIFFSHTGNNQLMPEVNVTSNTLGSIIDEINNLQGLAGLKNQICLDGKLRSNVRIFSNISVKIVKFYGIDTRKYYETENTVELMDLSEIIKDSTENILIALFNPEMLLHLIDESLSLQTSQFTYTDVLGREKRKEYKPIIDNIDFDIHIQNEPIYSFKNGESTLDELKIVHGESAKIKFLGEEFDKHNSRLLPEDLVTAIREIWELPDGKGTLRLFQEDALFFILSRLLKADIPKERQLLLSMPTGGGKTEAFMIPLLADIYQKKLKDAPKGVKTIIIYPTNALANDQAMRFVDMIYKVNRKLRSAGIPKCMYLSIGVLSGDTPNKSHDLKNESLIKICPRCGKSDRWTNKDNTIVCTNETYEGIPCGTRMDFCRLNKEDIIENPPDILITNPDEINFALHSPKYLPIFKTKIESIVFDEVHIYQGVFGCHIAQLLRRLEEMMEFKPLYIGLSATIGNAKDLAALLFDEPLENIRYIRNENRKYVTDTVVKTRCHALIKPYMRKTTKNKAGEARNKYVRTLSVAGSIGMFVGHLITDSHFRKSIIFTNYRSEADDLAGYLQERERLDVREYFDTVISKLQQKQVLTREEIEICEYLNCWFEKIIEKTKTINSSIEVGWTRGGLEKEDRIRSIHSFSRNNILADEQSDSALPIDIMVATKSLEVGIDIGDVTTVINSAAPFTINEYVQRVGRGGRKKDSLAITVINPENAIDSHLAKHFSDYVLPSLENYEDAPIIINNDIIVKRHVIARIVDFFNEQFTKIEPANGKIALTVGDIVNKVKIVYDGETLSLGQNCTSEKQIKYANHLYELVFGRVIDGKRADMRFLEFLRREKIILGTKECELSAEVFMQWFQDIIKSWQDHLIKNSKDKWQLDQNITGVSNAVMPELTPALRGSGATVSLYIGDNDLPVDVVRRQTAFNSMPLSAVSISTTKSGVSTFKVEDDKGESDTIAERQIRREICRDIPGRPVLNYFNRKFDDFPYDDELVEVAANLSVIVPNKLRVSYFPSRFYCVHCKKGLVPEQDYEERRNGVYCKNCGHKAQQLHKVYICENEECGAIFDPPIPKICINPECPTVKKAFAIYQANNFKDKVDMQKIFRFRLTKDLEWVCVDCGCRINFASWKRLMRGNPSAIQARISSIKKNDKTTIEGLCYRARQFPEHLNFKNQIIGRYKCSVPDHKSRKPVSAPRVRSIAYSFIGNKTEAGISIPLCASVETDNAIVTFNKGYVVQLAKNFMRRFSSGYGDSEVYTLKTEKIFERKYWGNYYESHLAWVKFGKKLDEFIIAKFYSCNGDCACCEKLNLLDLGSLMRPQRALEDYNFDQVNGKPKRPDYRSKYCVVAMNNECTRQYCVHTETGETCENFNNNDFLRYLVIHTIKHGLIWSLPKYAGVNVSEIKAEIYPNDNCEKSDIVFIDSNEGGSGAILLIKKHWDEIWAFAEEIIMLSSKNEANVILPHTCSRYNSDICPFIANEFFNYLR